MKALHSAYLTIVLTLSGAASAAAAVATDCLPRSVAPGAFRNQPLSWGNDSGPILNGFLDLRNGSGFWDIEHGVDLSHYNTLVVYKDLPRCGAAFAIIKMDDLFASHRNNLKDKRIKVVPYHYLSVVQDDGLDYKAHAERFSGPAGAKLTSEALQSLIDTAHAMGRSKARNFVAAYSKILPADEQVVDLAGMHGQLVAVDVEEVFQGKSTQIQRETYGRFYGAMLSAWIDEIHKQIPAMTIIFYTFPDVYTSYLQFALPDDYAVINAMPVWLARTRGNGEDFDLKSEKNLQRICWSNGSGNKCVLHQYSHRGIFAVANTHGRGIPPHIDLDRLFPIKEVSTSTGVQHVRRDDAAE